MGYPRFQYGGFSFMLVDPWPEYWAEDWYDTDDLYIDYDDGYYLYGSAQESDGTPIFIGARRRHVPGATNRFGFRKCVIINVYRLSK
jgi:hypothetical protein